MAALRRSLAHPASIFFIDEAPILFQYESLASLVARLCANGAKSGIRVILSAQEPESIAQSKSSSKIFANLTTRLVGRIQPTAIDAFVDILKYPREIINVNASEAYFPKKEGLYSQWLLDDSGYFTPCRYYPSHLLLACVANNPDESALRKTFLERYPNNKWVAYAEFQRAYVEMIMNEG
jgi:DNA helicase HerA-like ATPase